MLNGGNKIKEEMNMTENKKYIDSQIKQLLKLVERRWKDGILKFSSKISKFRDNEKIKTIRTSLYGDITLNAKELLFVDSFFLQRLRELSHMGFVYYVYPEARHSRFEHSLGVFWMIKKWVNSPFLRTKLRENDRMNLVCAALLHDIGHGPFSHFTESLLYYLGIDNILYPLEGKELSKYHERKAKSMILKLNCFSSALEKVGATPETVAQMIIGNSETKFARFINGPLDADKLDYYQRDAFFTGIPIGGIDAEFLMRTLRYNTEEGLYFTDKALSTIIQMMFNREYVYSIVTYHPVVRAIQSMILVAFVNALLLLQPETQAEILLSLDRMDDNDFWVMMDIIASSNIKNSKIKIVRDLLERVRSRDIYKRAFTLSLDECRGYRFNAIDSGDCKGSEYYIDDDFLPLKFISQDDEITSIINKNEVVIFEISPRPRGKEERKESIIKDFEKIKIEKGSEVVNLFDRLGNDGKTIVAGLASFQHLLNNAILLHPRIRGGNNDMLNAIRKKLKNEVGGLPKKVKELLIRKLEEKKNDI